MGVRFGQPSVRSVLCGCGCGQLAPLAKQTRRERGDKLGQPMRFLPGHSPSRFTRETGRAAVLVRLPLGLVRSEPERGYYAAHLWLREHVAKTGVCSACGEAKRTDWAWRHGGVGMPFSRDPDDYVELCRSCHVLRDQAEARAANTHVVS